MLTDKDHARTKRKTVRALNALAVKILTTRRAKEPYVFPGLTRDCPLCVAFSLKDGKVVDALVSKCGQCPFRGLEGLVSRCMETKLWEWSLEKPRQFACRIQDILVPAIRKIPADKAFTRKVWALVRKFAKSRGEVE